MTARRLARDGFTLIEVMLAISIGALVLLTVYGVLNAALSAREAIDRSNRAGRVALGIFNQLSRDLAAAYLYKDAEEGFVGQDHAEGGEKLDRLDFLTLSPSTIQKGETSSRPTEVGYQVQAVAGSPYYRLYRREAFYSDAKPGSGGDLVPLYDGVFRLDFGYQDGQGQSYSESWTGKKTLPVRVKVELGIWVGEGTPSSREKDREYTYTQVVAIQGQGLKLDLELKKKDDKEGEKKE